MAKSNRLKTKQLYRKLDKLLKEGLQVDLEKHPRWVIFSDLHMGDGGSTDDFKRNAPLFKEVLEKYYLKNDAALILNGDVEELQRFNVNKIYQTWEHVYDVFDRFDKKGNLYKTIGNHDLELPLLKNLPFSYQHYDSINMKYRDQDIFIYHGHQASKKYQQHNDLIGFGLKYFANPLGIKSYSVSHSSKKQYKIEKRAYEYSAFRKVISIIGHTHRPLFESLHKVDRLKFKIEQLCREFVQADEQEGEAIRTEIKQYRKELKKFYKLHKDHDLQNYVYNTIFNIPCVFNSGCVVGKRGMTCLEIEGEKIRLVHWFDKNISEKYLNKDYRYKPEKLSSTDYYRMIIDEESLPYIFTRIKFLT